MSTGAAFCRQTSTPQPQMPTQGTAGTPTEVVRLHLDGRPSLRIFQTCHGCAITFGSVWGCHDSSDFPLHVPQRWPNVTAAFLGWGGWLDGIHMGAKVLLRTIRLRQNNQFYGVSTVSLTISIHIRWFLFVILQFYKGHWVLIWAVWTFLYTVLIFN